MGVREFASLLTFKEKFVHMHIFCWAEGVSASITLSKEPCYPQDNDGNYYAFNFYHVKSLY